ASGATTPLTCSSFGMVRVPTRTTLKRSGWSTSTTAGSGAGSTWVVTAAADVSTSWRPHATNTGNPIASSTSTRWTGGRYRCRGTGVCRRISLSKSNAILGTSGPRSEGSALREDMHVADCHTWPDPLRTGDRRFAMARAALANILVALGGPGCVSDAARQLLVGRVRADPVCRAFLLTARRGTKRPGVACTRVLRGG